MISKTARYGIPLAAALAIGVGASGAAAQGRDGARVVAQAPVEDGIAVTRQRPDAILRLGEQYQLPPRFSREQRPMIIADLEAQPIYTRDGDEVGTVDRLVQGPDGQRYLVFDHGGFLGFGSEKLALPVDRFYLDGDRLVVWGASEEDIENMEGIDQAWGNVPAIQDSGPFGMNLGETGYRTE